MWFLTFVVLFGWQTVVFASTCNLSNPPSITEEQVYAGLPYTVGERSEYAVSFMGVPAGTASLEVQPPAFRDGHWLRVYKADAQTGKWYRAIFVGHDSILAYGFQNSGSYLVLDQDEGRLIGPRTRKHTEIQFENEKCQISERITESGNTTQPEPAEISSYVLDSVSATFRLRTLDYPPQTVIQLPVYSSKKSWKLEVEAVGHEVIEVPAGLFNTLKLRLRTFLGGALQQKGDLYLWLATDRPERPLVKMNAEAKIGSLVLVLTKFEPGATNH